MKLVIVLFGMMLAVVAASVIGNSTREMELTQKGYTKVNNLGYFKIYNDYRTWAHAFQQCYNDGGYLFIPNSEEEVNVVKSLMSLYPDEDYFAIGVHDQFLNGYFLTIHGDVFDNSKYALWNSASGEPNNLGGNEDCVVMLPTGFLNDLSCERKTFFVCEHEY
ncbi:Hemolymph lipopolysaccharide-binding protein [Blattella germanica]|nr:Hemolymph lipopolysaccharide-binding protein [Blattella germanica]